jgi:hypothetical protein
MFKFGFNRMNSSLKKILVLTDGVYPFVMGGIEKNSG